MVNQRRGNKTEIGEQEETFMDTGPLQPDPNLLTVPTLQPGTSRQGLAAPTSPTKNFKFYWVEKLDNSYSAPILGARSIPKAVHPLGVGAPKKRKKYEPDNAIK